MTFITARAKNKEDEPILIEDGEENTQPATKVEVMIKFTLTLFFPHTKFALTFHLILRNTSIFKLSSVHEQQQIIDRHSLLLDKGLQSSDHVKSALEAFDLLIAPQHIHPLSLRPFLYRKQFHLEMTRLIHDSLDSIRTVDHLVDIIITACHHL